MPVISAELLLESLEPLTRWRERDAVRVVLLLGPAGAEREGDAAPAHGVDLRDRDGERPRIPERRRAHHRAEADTLVSRASPASVIHESVGPGRPVLSNAR